jgi:hypothetical protein
LAAAGSKEMKNGTHVGSLLPERAPSEGPRSTAAVEPSIGVVPRGKNKHDKEFNGGLATNKGDAMKLRLPVCCRGVVLACSVAISLVLSGGVLQLVQAEGNSSQVQHCFDFSNVQQNYKNEEKAERALQQCYPIGSDATELIKYLASVADQATEPRKGYDSLNSNEPVTALSFTKVVDVGEENKNEWLVLLVLNLKSEILLSQVRLGYKGPNFHLRGIPYRRQQISGPDVIIKATMLKLLGPNITQEKVDSFMTEFGATKSQIKEDFKFHPSNKEVYTKIDYITVRNEQDKFITRYFDYAWVRTGIFWVFDSQGRFFDVYISTEFASY